ncbi:MAG: preprotein translocase subunit YajC [Candidatus Microbacterium phytovorans]|uniref:Preprotein translocase subunit YajC n=1 Tax=Candidatus Microbacterium phytovorans TaxID=3121374 RepID=A0AAJ6B3N4_9MICO|nr:preprotein translocase subunit YajC [Microbacterium sp.]WEK14345.1 MAG: preprotein translocase subunit YajC [Microbacterium sp.]
MIFATSQDAPQMDPVSSFFAQYGMLLLLLALIVFMFWSSRRRSARMKAEQESKQRAMVPGVKVLLQGGLYGTLVSFDADDLSRPAIIALAPGVEIEVHSQAIIRVVEDDEPVTEDEYVEAETDAVEADPVAATDSDVTPDADDKPRA